MTESNTAYKTFLKQDAQRAVEAYYAQALRQVAALKEALEHNLAKSLEALEGLGDNPEAAATVLSRLDETVSEVQNRTPDHRNLVGVVQKVLAAA